MAKSTNHKHFEVHHVLGRREAGQPGSQKVALTMAPEVDLY
jgi:hypothetical protein